MQNPTLIEGFETERRALDFAASFGATEQEPHYYMAGCDGDHKFTTTDRTGAWLSRGITIRTRSRKAGREEWGVLVYSAK